MSDRSPDDEGLAWYVAPLLLLIELLFVLLVWWFGPDFPLSR